MYFFNIVNIRNRVAKIRNLNLYLSPSNQLEKYEKDASGFPGFNAYDSGLKITDY